MSMDETDVYREDAESCRYQDNLRWSRFQVAALIDGGLAWILWSADPARVGAVTTLLLTIGGLLLIVLLGWLSQKDEADYAGHLKRIRKIEKTDVWFDPVREKAYAGPHRFPFPRVEAVWTPIDLCRRKGMPRMRESRLSTAFSGANRFLSQSKDQ